VDEGGKLTKLHDIPNTANNQKVELGGACGINPKDEIMYCTSENYLVRFDQKYLRYVAKLASASSAGTFSSNGDWYYDGTGYGGLYKASGIHNLVDYNDKGGIQDNSPGDFSNDQEFADSINAAQALVTYIADLGEGKQEYLVTLNSLWEIVVLKLENGQRWTIDTDFQDPSGNDPEAFGSGWTFKETDDLFFSEDSGMGVYRVSKINLDDSKATIEKVDESATACEACSVSFVGSIRKNDGMGCGDMAMPRKWGLATTTTTTVTFNFETTKPVGAPGPTAIPGKCLPGFEEKKPCGCKNTVRCKKSK
jgi:hypothetical protein